MLPWPVRSPDLSLIGHVWNIMVRQLQHHPQQALTVPVLTQQTQKARRSLPQSDIRYLRMIIFKLWGLTNCFSIISYRGYGSLVVKVSDCGWLVTSSSPVPLKTRRVGERWTLNLSRVQTFSRWCGVVARRGRGVPAQVSSSSLDHGPKLRGPSPKALV
ncbi:uncharacterized protein TNCV_4577471 [Trichonephila clavipes]|nr:uncharacterized protein TNCV_4577471 [Trichonephila clavipes]